jgi:hypothetical protein
VQFDHPSLLCRQLADSELDGALVSSFEYLRNPIYSVVDGLAIASHGPVFSVILAHRGPIERLREVVVDPASETSVHLLRCLLGERGLAPEFVFEGEMDAERGGLLIGDQAIRFRQERAEDFQILDLGAEWDRTTGQPFAEIFDPAVRDELCRGKENAAEWLEVHRTWHEMGGRSTCTMLYGHIETLEQRVDHLRQLRELQDETHGFTGFIPFAFEPGEGTVLSHIPHATAFDQLRNLAVSRIYLDNIEHLTAYWVSMGLPLAQVSLSYGVDDLHGTIMREKIFHMAGVTTPEEQTVETLRHAIREAGRDPVQRDSYYNHVTPAKSAAAPEADRTLVCA